MCRGHAFSHFLHFMQSEGFSVFLSEVFVVLAVNRKIFICSAFFLVIKSKVLWYRNVLRTACRAVVAACAGHGYRSFYNVYCLAYDFKFFLDKGLKLSMYPVLSRSCSYVLIPLSTVITLSWLAANLTAQEGIDASGA